jgi:hypothetical protein
MKKNTKVSVMTAAEKAPVEYDGYYLIDVVARNGFCLTIPARGYDLKSWLNFERGLGSTVEYRAVSEQEWTRLHWTQIPYEEAEKIITVQSAIDYMTNIVGENV